MTDVFLKEEDRALCGIFLESIWNIPGIFLDSSHNISRIFSLIDPCLGKNAPQVFSPSFPSRPPAHSSKKGGRRNGKPVSREGNPSYSGFPGTAPTRRRSRRGNQ